MFLLQDSEVVVTSSVNDTNRILEQLPFPRFQMVIPTLAAMAFLAPFTGSAKDIRMALDRHTVHFTSFTILCN